MAAEELHVSDAFTASGREAWQDAVERGPRGVAWERLRRPAEDPRLTIEPVYFPEDAPSAERVGWPGVPPFVRGAHPLGAGEHGWRAVCRPDAHDVVRAAAQLEDDLRAGAAEAWLRVGADRGVRVVTAGDLDVLLRGLDPAEVPLQFDPGPDAFPVMAAAAEVLETRGVPLQHVRGGWGFDPLGTLLEEGELFGGLRGHWARLREAARWSLEQTPAMTVALVREAPLAEAGAGGVLRLGLALATGAEYLRHMLEAGLHIDQAAPRVRFSLAVGQDFFVEVARLRAARLAWAKLVAAFGGGEEVRRMRMHAQGALHYRTRWDAWGNLLRAANEAMAAVLGGAEAVTVLPHDALFGAGDSRSRRLARNVHWLLREEARLARVADPAAGSWYVEALTERIARDAWEVMRVVERQGGMARAIRRGYVHRMVTHEGEHQRERVARRALSSVGVSEFPDEQEPLPPETPPDRWVDAQVGRPHGHANPERRMASLRDAAVAAYHAATADGSTQEPLPDVVTATRRAVADGADLYVLREAMAAALPNLYVQPLPAWRRAESWEALRESAHRFARIRGHRPRARLLALGPPAEHRALLDWAHALLAAGGFEVQAAPLDGDRDATDSLVVLCATATRLRTEASEQLATLRARGVSRLAVASEALEAGTARALREHGVRWILHAGANLLEALLEVQRSMGVRP